MEEIRDGDVTVNSRRGATQAVGVFSHVNARAMEAVCRRIVDPLDLETLMQVIPSCRFAGIRSPSPSRYLRE